MTTANDFGRIERIEEDAILTRTDLEDEIRELKGEIHRKTREFEDARDEIKVLQNSNERKSNEKEMTKIQDLQDEIHRKTRELEDARDEINVLQDSNRKDMTKLQDLHDEIRRKTRELEDVRDELRNSNVRKEMSEKVVDPTIVQNKLQNLRLETKELRDTIVSQRDDMMEMMSTWTLEQAATLEQPHHTRTTTPHSNNTTQVLYKTTSKQIRMHLQKVIKYEFS